MSVCVFVCAIGGTQGKVVSTEDLEGIPTNFNPNLLREL